MSKPKALLKHPKGKKKKEPVLETADDYLAAGVDDEDAMGKHRGGDAAKSLRFGRKALEIYTQGLVLFPKNPELAYNKGRLELELATHPVLVKALDLPVVDLLQQSLLSHQYAASIEPDNADTLFNTAQVLTALAEISAKESSTSDAIALQYLEKALTVQRRCYEIQQARYAESRALQEQAASSNHDSEDEDGGAQIDLKVSTAFEEHGNTMQDAEQWVSIVEPVTIDSLIDTLLAQLSTLTTLCSIVSASYTSGTSADSNISTAWIEDYATKLAGDELPALLKIDPQETATRIQEISLTKATLASNLVDLAYRSGSLGSTVYVERLDLAWAEVEMTTEALVAFSRALVSFNIALIEVDLSGETEGDAIVRWNALTKAQKLLNTAASLPSTKLDPFVFATTHLLRGDVSLSMHVLSYPPSLHVQSISNSAQILKNAEVFYRNALKLFSTLANEGAVEKELAAFRCAVASILQNTGHQLLGNVEGVLREASVTKSDQWRKEQLQDMIDEGMLIASAFGI